MRCTVAESRPWTHLLYHSSFDNPRQERFTVTKTRWAVVCQALGVAHPALVEARQGYSLQARSKQTALRRRIYGNWEFAEQALSKSFCVAQSEWTPALRRAFALDDPPSPYEVVVHLLDTAYPTLGKKHACGRSSLMWWLVGIGAEALEKVNPGWEEEAAKAIEGFMRLPSFALWALGSDLRPVILSRKHAKALVLMDRKSWALRREMYVSTYVQAQLYSGRRIKPVPRILPEMRPIWQNMQERERWEEEGRWLDKLSGTRKNAWDTVMLPKGYTMPKNWEPQPRETI